MRSLPQPDRVVETIGRATVLDSPARLAKKAVDTALPTPTVRDALHGVWLGHPLHPAIVLLPLGSWISASRARPAARPAPGRGPDPGRRRRGQRAAGRGRRLDGLVRPAPRAAADRAGARRRQRGHHRPPARLLAGPAARPAGPRRGAQPGRAGRRRHRGVPGRPPGLPAGRRDRPRRGGARTSCRGSGPGWPGWTSCPTASRPGAPSTARRSSCCAGVGRSTCSTSSARTCPVRCPRASCPAPAPRRASPAPGTAARSGSGTDRYGGARRRTRSRCCGSGSTPMVPCKPDSGKRTDHGTRKQQALAPARRRDGARGRGDDDGRAPDPGRGVARARARGRGPGRPRPARRARRPAAGRPARDDPRGGRAAQRARRAPAPLGVPGRRVRAARRIWSTATPRTGCSSWSASCRPAGRTTISARSSRRSACTRRTGPLLILTRGWPPGSLQVNGGPSQGGVHGERDREQVRGPGGLRPSTTGSPSTGLRLGEPQRHELVRRPTTTRRTCGWRRTRWRCAGAPAGTTPAGMSSATAAPATGTRCSCRSAAARAVPAAVSAEVRAVSRGEALRPAVRMTTQRTEWPLLAEDGTVLALVADDDVATEVIADPAAAQRWRELEVELVGGDRALLRAVDKRLRKIGAPARPTWPRSPARSTAAGRTRPRPPARPAAALPSSASTCGRSATRSSSTTRGCAGTSRTRCTRCASRPGGCAARSSRTGRCGTGPTDHLRAELKWLADVLGKVRDAEVMVARLERSLDYELLAPSWSSARSPPGSPAGCGPRRSRTTARWSARSTAGGTRRCSTSSTPCWRPRRRTRACGRRRSSCRGGSGARSARSRTCSTRPTAPRPAARRSRVCSIGTALHEARKAAKQARYAAEAAVPVGGSGAIALATAMEDLQEAAGEQHDGGHQAAAAHDRHAGRTPPAKNSSPTACPARCGGRRSPRPRDGGSKAARRCGARRPSAGSAASQAAPARLAGGGGRSRAAEELGDTARPASVRVDRQEVEISARARRRHRVVEIAAPGRQRDDRPVVVEVDHPRVDDGRLAHRRGFPSASLTSTYPGTRSRPVPAAPAGRDWLAGQDGGHQRRWRARCGSPWPTCRLRDDLTQDR